MKKVPALLKLAFVFCSLLGAKELPEEPRRGFEDFFRLAVEQGHQLGEQRAKVLAAEADQEFAISKAWFTGQFTTLAGPVPGATGNAINGETDWDRWGVLSATSMELFQPIYTFGALSEARKAAKHGIKAEKALLDRDKYKLRYEIAELYYGYQLAFELSDIAIDAEKKLQEALKKTKKAADRDKLIVILNELTLRKNEAEKGLKQAKMGMAWKIGRYSKAEPRWDRANLKPREIELKDLQQYRKISKENRPERIALREGVEAKRSLWEVEQSRLLPALGFGAKLDYSYSPHREDQLSPFANDDFNRLEGGIGVGIRWNLDFAERSAKASKLRAEFLQVEAKLRHYDVGMDVELEKSYQDLQHAQKGLELRNEAAGASKRLFQDALVAYNLDRRKSKELMEAFGRYAMAQKAALEAVYQHNLLLIKLESTVGASL